MAKFDLVTHHIHPKTGQVYRKTPYRLHVANGNRVFEREGKYFLENGIECDAKGKVMEKVKEVVQPAQLQAVKQPSKPSFEKD